MRLLLDECTPRQLAAELRPHEAAHVTELGWSGTKNGALLARMEQAGYLGLITTDKNIGFQQSVASTRVFVVVLAAPSNRVRDLRALMPELLRRLEFVQPGQVLRVGA